MSSITVYWGGAHQKLSCSTRLCYMCTDCPAFCCPPNHLGTHSTMDEQLLASFLEFQKFSATRNMGCDGCDARYCNHQLLFSGMQLALFKDSYEWMTMQKPGSVPGGWSVTVMYCALTILVSSLSLAPTLECLKNGLRWPFRKVLSIRIASNDLETCRRNPLEGCRRFLF